jgi:hypothetical protein
VVGLREAPPLASWHAAARGTRRCYATIDGRLDGVEECEEEEWEEDCEGLHRVFPFFSNEGSVGRSLIVRGSALFVRRGRKVGK